MQLAASSPDAYSLAQPESQRQATRPGLAGHGTFSPVRASWPAVDSRLARTLSDPHESSMLRVIVDEEWQGSHGIQNRVLVQDCSCAFEETAAQEDH